MDHTEFEKPILGYVVVAVGLITGMMTACVLGQPPADSAVRPAGLVAVECQGTHGSADARQRETGARQWVLGVRVKPTFLGCVVTEVIDGGAAKRSGVVVGDRILAAGGTQVGWIDSRRIRLDEVLDRSATPATGLLVQKRSTGRLATVAVRLQTPTEALGH